jgi:phosphatidylglycerol---prolipoprotein diacylglyceryl transferase
MTTDPGYIVHTPHRFLIQFSETWGIRYYGLAYVLGFVLAGVLLHFYWKRGRSPFGPVAQADLLLYVMIGTLVGGRLGYFLFYDAGRLLHDPLALFRFLDGGMASHGGFIGVFIALWWAARRFHVPLRSVGDIAVTLAPPGLLLGRIANYLNGELWGKVTDVPWAVIFTTSDPTELNPAFIAPRHPSQLYEAALEGLALLVWTQFRIWLTPAVMERPGRLAGEFLLGYAVARVVCEQFREPDWGIEPFLGLNRGAWLSLVIAVAGVFLIVTARRTVKPTPTVKPRS